MRMDQDAFRDPAFVSRLGKLLPMLGSSQAGEAEAARTKLLEHLSHHRLSLNDLAERLGGAPAPRGYRRRDAEDVPRLDLQQALEAARLAENRAHTLVRQNAVLRRQLDQVELARQKLTARRNYGLIVGISGYVFLGLGALIVYGGVFQPPAQQPLAAANPPVTIQSTFPRPSLAPDGDAGRTATVLADGQPVRADPVPGSPVRTYLPRGTSVQELYRVTRNGLEWSQVRSDAGVGFIPSTSITR